jgi:hypothetical protein
MSQRLKLGGKLEIENMCVAFWCLTAGWVIVWLRNHVTGVWNWSGVGVFEYLTNV